MAQSFASMCANSMWGIPRIMYYDNGSEYQWKSMMDGFWQLSAVLGCDFASEPMSADMKAALERDAIVTAQPYNAAAKSIEGIFGVLERQYFSQIEGWVAGDRSRKKTQNVGKEPKPFSGSFESLTAQLDLMLRAYHNQPQQGQLGGKSPNQIIAQQVERGYKAARVRPEALLLAFAELYTPTVRQGRVVVNKRHYRHEALFALDKKLNVRVARHDPRFAFVFDDQRLLCVAAEDVAYGIVDPRGAEESKQRKATARRQITTLRSHCDALVLVDEHANHLARIDHKPLVPDGDVVELSAQVKTMVEGLETAVREQIANRADGNKLEQLNQWAAGDDELNRLRAEMED